MSELTKIIDDLKVAISWSGNIHGLIDLNLLLKRLEKLNEHKPIEFNEGELLTIMDWFNGYVSKYYGSDPEIISQKLPSQHKNLIDKILKNHEERFSVPLTDEERELLKLNKEESKK